MHWSFSDSENLAFFSVELHLPAFLSVSKPVKVVFRTHCACLVVNGDVCNSVVCKEAHDGVEVLGKVADVEKEQAQSEHRALGDSWCDQFGPAPLPIDDQHLCTVGQEALNPVHGVAPYPVTCNLPQQVHVTDFVKSLTEVKDQYVSFVASVAVTRQVMQELYKLCFTWEHASEPVL